VSLIQIECITKVDKKEVLTIFFSKGHTKYGIILCLVDLFWKKERGSESADPKPLFY